MQGPVRFLHRNFFRRSHDATLRPAYARGEGPPPRRAEGRARRFRPRVPGPDRRRGTGGAAVNCPTTRCSTPAAAPRTGPGFECAPAPRPGSQDPVPPVRRPAARAAQGPPAQGEPDRDRARRSLTRIRPGQGLLLAVQPPTGRGPRLLPANRPQCPGSPPGGRLGPGRARGQQSDRPGYLADLASGAGNPPHSLKPVGPTPQNGWGAPPQTGWTRIQNRGRRRERRIPKIRVRTITTGDPSDPDTGPRVLRRPDPTPGTPGCARLPARQFARRSPHFPTWGCRASGPRSPGN